MEYQFYFFLFYTQCEQEKKLDSLLEATATFWNVLMSDKHEIISKSLVYVLNVQHIDLGKMSPVI